MLQVVPFPILTNATNDLYMQNLSVLFASPIVETPFTKDIFDQYLALESLFAEHVTAEKDDQPLELHLLFKESLKHNIDCFDQFLYLDALFSVKNIAVSKDIFDEKLELETLFPEQKQSALKRLIQSAKKMIKKLFKKRTHH